MTTKGRKKSALRDQRGVVYVETLVAFVPVFTLFLATIQLADLSAANLIVRHASTVAARAAAVVLPDDGVYYGDRENQTLHTFTGLRKTDIEQAANLILRANPRLDASAANVSLDKSTYSKRDDLTATVRASYRCLLPLFCPSVVMTGESKLVYQGAEFEYEATTLGDFGSRPNRPPETQPVSEGPPQTPNNPNDPNTPTPNNPAPNNPSPNSPTPNNPTPNNPQQPNTPPAVATGPNTGSPNHPTTPGQPGSPNSPNTPSNPTPNNPTPNNPNTPPSASPSSPQQPSTPPAVATGPNNGSPNHPTTPGQPGSPNNPSTPSTPNSPNHPTTPPSVSPSSPHPSNTPPAVATGPNNGSPNSPANPGQIGTAAPNTQPASGHDDSRPNGRGDPAQQDPIASSGGEGLPPLNGTPSAGPTHDGTPNSPSGVDLTKPQPSSSPPAVATGPAQSPSGPGVTSPSNDRSSPDGRPNDSVARGDEALAGNGRPPRSGESGGTTPAPGQAHNPSREPAGASSPRGPPGSVGSSLPVNVGAIGPLAGIPAGSSRRPACTGRGCNSPTGACFVAGTLVSTPDGTRAIETIAIGDRVHAFDETRGQVVIGDVSNAFSRSADVLVDLTVRYLDGGGEHVITGTPDHPFYLPATHSYVALGALPEGAILLTRDGVAARVESASSRLGHFVVYNFAVAKEHNYFVLGSNDPPSGVLVHNALCPPETPEERAERSRQVANRTTLDGRIELGPNGAPRVSTIVVNHVRRNGQTEPVRVTRTAASVPPGSTYADGQPVPAGTTRVTYSGEVDAGTDEASTWSIDYYLDDRGRTVRVEAPIDPRGDYKKASLPSEQPPGFVSGPDDRGHIATEGLSPAPFLANVPENLPAEHARSNQKPSKGSSDQEKQENKYNWEERVREYVTDPANAGTYVSVHTVQYPELPGGIGPIDPRPLGTTHQVFRVEVVNGQQVRVEVPELQQFVPNPARNVPRR